MWRRRGLFFGETSGDLERPEERLNDALALGLAALAQRGIELVKIRHAGHGGWRIAVARP